MGEVEELILDGVLDYETGEYIGSAVGYPRTIRKYRGNPKELRMSDLNKYGYTHYDWERMKPCTKKIISYLYDEGYTSVRSRQKVMDDFMYGINAIRDGNRLPKNSRKYGVIWNNINEFKKFISKNKNEQLNLRS